MSKLVSMVRCRSTSGELVFTFMPSSAARTQAAASTRPPTSTTQMRQTPTGFSLASWQSTGMSMPASRAASNTVAPAGTVTEWPSMVSVMG